MTISRQTLIIVITGLTIIIAFLLGYIMGQPDVRAPKMTGKPPAGQGYVVREYIPAPTLEPTDRNRGRGRAYPGDATGSINPALRNGPARRLEKQPPVLSNRTLSNRKRPVVRKAFPSAPETLLKESETGKPSSGASVPSSASSLKEKTGKMADFPPVQGVRRPKRYRQDYHAPAAPTSPYQAQGRRTRPGDRRARDYRYAPRRDYRDKDYRYGYERDRRRTYARPPLYEDPGYGVTDPYYGAPALPGYESPARRPRTYVPPAPPRAPVTE